MFDENFVKNTLTPALGILGFFLGMIGTGLGVWNLWLNRKSHKLRIRVDAIGGGSDSIEKVDGVEKQVPSHRKLTVRVINDSYFPVTVREVGVVFRPSFFKRRIYWRLRQHWNRELGPTRIEARDSQDFDVIISSNSVKDPGPLYHLVSNPKALALTDAVAVYACLATGQRYTGGRKTTKAILAEIKQATLYFEKWLKQFQKSK